MACYAAVISLEQTIQRLLNSSQISIFPSSRKIIDFAYERVGSLQEVLHKLESKNNTEMVDTLCEQIRGAVYKLEDALESHISDQFLSRSEGVLGDEISNSVIFSLDTRKGKKKMKKKRKVLKQEIKNFTDLVKQMEDECSNPDLELNNLLPEEDDVDSLRVDFGEMESRMVGLHNEFSLVRDTLQRDSPYGRSVFTICGMAGIGKTILAKKIYQDAGICSHFGHRVWVKIGQKFQLRKTMLRILAQLDHDIDRMQMEGDEQLGKYMSTSLESRRYLIVLDDVWNKEVCYMLQKYLPFDHQSWVLLTTRRQCIAHFIKGGTYNMYFLNEEQSWCLLREKVFREEACPPQLEKAGKKIAQNCDGLPLLIVTVANLLSKAEKTVEYWNKVAEKKDMSIFVTANDKISNILLRSYKYLPQNLKACFLCMGVFPSKYEIPASKLIDLWTAEDLFESKFYESSTHLGKKYIYELLLNNVVLLRKPGSLVGVKSCGLHTSFRHACIKQSWKEKFLHVISSFADSCKEGIERRRRLCILNNSLLGFKEVHSSMEYVSSARSLICSGPNHQYPVSICFGQRLLKVLDVLSIRFYKFPIEVLKLVHLKYLALSYNGKVPHSISKLWNLEYLIICRHVIIKYPRDQLYLPLEIWNLRKLRHLNVMGSCLPYLFDALLPNLIKVSNMSVYNCTKDILGRIPNLQKLGIQIELALDASEPLSCFDHLCLLNKLESLKCVIVNPNPAKPQVVALPTCISSFPSTLTKLSLSGFGYSWEYMHIIAKLPRLKALKLRNYAFRGPEWIVYKSEFESLEFLLLEDIDLVHFKSDDHCLPKLEKLIVKHCYKLREIPLPTGNILWMEIVDSPFVANHVRENEQFKRNTPFWHVHIDSSWHDGKLKSYCYLSDEILRKHGRCRSRVGHIS